MRVTHEMATLEGKPATSPKKNRTSFQQSQIDNLIKNLVTILPSLWNSQRNLGRKKAATFVWNGRKENQ